MSYYITALMFLVSTVMTLLFSPHDVVTLLVFGLILFSLNWSFRAVFAQAKKLGYDEGYLDGRKFGKSQ